MRTRVWMLGCVMLCLLGGCTQSEELSAPRDIYIAASSNTGSYTRLVKEVFQNAIPKRKAYLEIAINKADAQRTTCRVTPNYLQCNDDLEAKLQALKAELARLQSLGFENLNFKACKSVGSRRNIDILRGVAEPLPRDNDEIPKDNKPLPKPLLDDCTDKNVQFAIIQNDIAYRAQKDESEATAEESKADYLNFSALRSVVPLVPGYIQIIKPGKGVVSDSQVAGNNKNVEPDDPSDEVATVPEFAKLYVWRPVGNTSAKLAPKPIALEEAWPPDIIPTIALGGRQSATPTHASKLINNTTYGMAKKPYLDYEPVYTSSADCKDTDLLMRSSNIEFFDNTCKRTLQHVELPPRLIRQLINGFDYYERVRVPTSFVAKGAPKEMLSVGIYLMTVKDADDALVHALTKALVNAWPELTREAAEHGLSLIPIETGVRRQPVEYHSGAEKAFIEAGLISDTKWNLSVFLSSVLLVATLIIATYFQSTYGRMGTIIRTSFIQRMADRIVGGAFWVLLIAIAGIALSLAITGLQAVEQSAARATNTENDFAGINFVDAFVWIFTFMVSGYENNIYPQSVPGRILISLIALLGLIVPLTGIYRGFNKARDRRALHARGLASYEQFHNHLIICGWNAKANGIVWSLSGGDGVSKKDIVIVTNFAEDEPLRALNFNKRVHYCRGNPTDRDILAKAGVAHAESVIVLASDDAHGRHISTAITALAVRDMNKHVFLAAEQGGLGNESYLEAANVDAIVHPELVANRATAAGIINSYAPDFLLDALTIDQFYEWYALSGAAHRSVPGWARGLATQPIREIQMHAAQRGINIIGVAREGDEHHIRMCAPDKKYQPIVDLLLDKESEHLLLQDNDYLVCAAYDWKTFRGRRQPHSGISDLKDSKDAIIQHSQVLRVALAGLPRRTRAVSQSLQLSYPDIIVKSFDMDLAEPIDSEADVHFISEVQTFAPDVVAIFGQPMAHEQNASDERTVLLAKLLRGRLEPTTKLLAELHNLGNRSLFHEIDIIVPVNLLAERFLTRLAISKGSISETLYTMIDPDAEYGLQSVELTADHPLLGTPLSQALTTRYVDGRIIGALPASMRKTLRNDQHDFSTHFAMCAHADQALNLGVGDVVVAIARKH